MNPDQLADFDRHLDALERQHGINLDADDRRELLEQSVNGGFTPQATEAAFADWFGDDESWDDDTENFPARDDDGGDWDDDEHDHEDGMRELAQADYHAAAGEFVRGFGRGLTGAEAERLAEAATNERGFDQRWRPEHFERAAERTGVRRWSDMDDNDQAEAMAARLRESHGLDPETGIDPNKEFDMDDEQDWAEAAALRMQGYEFEDA